MPFTNLFLVSCRLVSIFIVLLVGLTFDLESMSFRAIFIGLLFSHFAMGFYYSKNNVVLMKEKKFALVFAGIILSIGLYFSLFVTYLAPYFLVVHAALSDAYLLRLKSTKGNGERLAILRTIFYSCCASISFIAMPQILMNIFLVVAVISLVAILIETKDKTTLSLFEFPLISIVIYTQVNQEILHFHYMGFYHIVTWYVFSFWMLFFKEKSIQKTISFFSKITLMSVVFIVLFNNLFGYNITDQSFLKIIGTWSILHIFSTIPLSKFNPRFIKELFYAK